jgi:hypothetical protein
MGLPEHNPVKQLAPVHTHGVGSQSLPEVGKPASYGLR